METLIICAPLQSNGSLSTTDKLESFLESAPKGLVLKVVTRGDSNLEVGQLVDGELRPVNGTNMTAVMTNVSSADNKVGRTEGN